MVLRGFVKFFAVLLITVSLLVCVISAVAYFTLRNFDPNQFRAEIERSLSRQTGLRVQLGKIHLKWGLRPELGAESLKLSHSSSLDILLQSGPLQLQADLTTVWYKLFNVSHVVIRDPHIVILRKFDGTWNWQNQALKTRSGDGDGMNPRTIPTSAKNVSPGNAKWIQDAGKAWGFSIDKIQVKNGTITFIDQTAQPVSEVQVDAFEVEIKPKGGITAFDFNAKGSVFHSRGAKKNLVLNGNLDLEAQSLDFALRYSADQVQLKGRLKMLNDRPRFEGSLDVRDLDMDSVIPSSYKNGAYLTGLLNAKAQGSFAGANPKNILSSLNGQGKIEIRNGAYKNRNLIKEVFDRMSSVIAITDALGGALPPEVDQMLRGTDTPFQVLNLVGAAGSGAVQVSELNLIHPDYQLAGQGVYGMQDRRIDSALRLVFASSISGYLVKKIHLLLLIHCFCLLCNSFHNS